MNTSLDVIDELLASWREVHPNLDASPLALVGRILVLANHLERSVELALKAHQLTLGQFDILATLRRNSGKGGLSPTSLLKNVMLSSGAMTTRLDKLEAAGLVTRERDPDDRRAIIVMLTAKGKTRIDAATKTRFSEAQSSLPTMTPAEQTQLIQLLRKWLGTVELKKRNSLGK